MGHLATIQAELLLQAYEKEEAWRLNEVITIIGIKSTVPELAAVQLQSQHGQMDFIDEEIAARPPTSLVRPSAIKTSAAVLTTLFVICPEGKVCNDGKACYMDSDIIAWRWVYSSDSSISIKY